MKRVRFVALVAGALTVAAGLGGADIARAETPADTLVVGFSLANVMTLDPAGSSGRERVQLITNLYDELVALDPKDMTHIVPQLAESWDIAEHQRSITFRLRPGMKFASGNPITAQDVAWSLQRVLKTNQSQSSHLRARGFTAANAAENIIAVDATTLTIRLPTPTDPKIVLMALALSGPGTVIDRVEALKHEKDGDQAMAWLSSNVAGSGAYTLQQWKPGELALLKRNPNYWGPKPPAERIIMRNIPESQSQRLMLDKGDLDIAYSLSAADLASFAGNKAVIVQTGSGNGLYYLALSLGDEALAKKPVREAIRGLIDYEGINKAIMPFYGTEHLLPAQRGALGERPAPDIKLSLEAAKARLAAAGYPNGLDLTLRAIAEPPFSNLATAIQGSLAPAGIRVKIITGTGEQVYGPMRERNFQMVVGRSGGQVPHTDADLRLVAYNPDNRQEAKLSGILSWRVSFQDQKINQMIDAALLEPYAARQRQAYRDIEAYYVDIAAPILPISQVSDSIAYRANVKDLVIHPLWQTKLATVSKTR
jgi:peptide/nickel transport system substrate-binding protein